MVDLLLERHAHHTSLDAGKHVVLVDPHDLVHLCAAYQQSIGSYKAQLCGVDLGGVKRHDHACLGLGTHDSACDSCAACSATRSQCNSGKTGKTGKSAFEVRVWLTAKRNDDNIVLGCSLDNSLAVIVCLGPHDKIRHALECALTKQQKLLGSVSWCKHAGCGIAAKPEQARSSIPCARKRRSWGSVDAPPCWPAMSATKASLMVGEGMFVIASCVTITRISNLFGRSQSVTRRTWLGDVS